MFAFSCISKHHGDDSDHHLTLYFLLSDVLRRIHIVVKVNVERNQSQLKATTETLGKTLYQQVATQIYTEIIIERSMGL